MNRSFSSRRGFTTLALAAVIGVAGLAASATSHAQATAGVVFGNAPAGDTVTARNINNGTKREVQVPANGRYALRALPVGVYSVTLMENGKALVQHPKVPVAVGRGIKVDFDCAQGSCAGATGGQ